MDAVHAKRAGGFSFIEVMLAMVTIVIGGTGALAYQYLGAKHFRIAHAELTATRTGQLLLEDWKGSGGVDPQNYDATALGLGFLIPETDEYGDYVLTVDGVRMYIWLSYTDVAVDSFAGVTLRQISVKIQWRNDFGPGVVAANDPSVVLTTYCRLGRD